MPQALGSPNHLQQTLCHVIDDQCQLRPMIPNIGLENQGDWVSLIPEIDNSAVTGLGFPHNDHRLAF
jgi:hypothetical protein